jgi:acyl-CoA dehydrogenase
MISFTLTEDQRIIQETVRKFASDELRPHLRDFERARAIPVGLQKKFHELGLSVLELPEPCGGQGLGTLTAMLVHEELAFGDPGAAVALWAPHVAAAAIYELGDDEQRKRLIPRFAQQAGHRGALAYSEKWKVPQAGFATVAQQSGEGYLLTGAKSFVINGGIADLTVVFAQVDAAKGWDGIGAFALEGTPDSMKMGARHELLGLETVHAAELVFDGCKVPPRNRLLGGDDFQTAARRLFGRIALVGAARQVGLARAAYEYALAYTQERQAFGKPVAHFQSIAFTLADMHMDVESTRWMIWRAAVAFDSGRPDAILPIAEAAVHANEAAWRVADNAVQLLGGAGFVQDYPAEKWLRDTKALALAAPTDQLSQLLVASAVLGRPGDFGPGLSSSDIQPIFT